ncbi:hypothetical protein JCM9279_005525 [Rhodotorula babjevae]
MCRWIAYFSTQPILVADVILRPEHSIVKQRRFLFMHNGAVGGFIDAQVRILSQLSHSARLTIQGNTDSEHVFALFLTFLDPHGPWLRDYRPGELEAALERTVSTLIKVCEPARGWLERDGRTVRSWLSLNIAISDGSTFLALRFAHPPERDPPSLYWSSVGGSALDRRYRSHPDGGPDVGDLPRKEHDPHVVVASDPMTRAKRDGWALMRPGEDSVVDDHGALSPSSPFCGVLLTGL